MLHQLDCNDAGEIPFVAKKILQACPKQHFFIFRGNLGAGKTTLIKAMCSELGVADPTNSPSFAIVNEYLMHDGRKIYHFDLFRLEKPDDLYDIGYEEYFFSGNYCFVEWPEIAVNLLPEEYVEIVISINEKNNSRLISFRKKN
ncbi:MAG: tRNA (adenosine(37)-N6)-threonylcarbamoyltransferase complex ATPase subunit type 1 TsaE [Bacteroidales bacterium]|nr:tRNA (adenosine(37)-N6)-threonylcarbamoyltransferase complex ATPase subunit type 1 TsaE [Bacteroidales bacterium]